MINGKLQNCRYRRQVGGGAEFFRQVTLARTDIRIRTHRQTDNSKTTPPGLSIRWAQAPKINERLVLEYDTIRYDTIRDAILTCAEKLTRGSLIYRTEPKTKKVENGQKRKYR